MGTTMNDKAKVKVPPPLFFLTPLAGGLALQMVFPLRFLPAGSLQLAIGVSIAIIGLAFSLIAARTLVRAKTDLMFTKSTTAVVIRGPYQISRNPIYAGASLMYVGVAIALNSLWSLGLFPAAILLILLGAILPEERYLEQKFGREYLTYKSRVRRWL